MAEKWMAGAVKNPGYLHRALGVSQDKKIPASKVEAATHSDNTHLARAANLAQTFAHHHPHPHSVPHAKHAHRQTHPSSKLAHHASGK